MISDQVSGRYEADGMPHGLSGQALIEWLKTDGGEGPWRILDSCHPGPHHNSLYAARRQKLPCTCPRAMWLLWMWRKVYRREWERKQREKWDRLTS